MLLGRSAIAHSTQSVYNSSPLFSRRIEACSGLGAETQSTLVISILEFNTSKRDVVFLYESAWSPLAAAADDTPARPGGHDHSLNASFEHDLNLIRYVYS
jgi:hypothetical protein